MRTRNNVYIAAIVSIGKPNIPKNAPAYDSLSPRELRLIGTYDTRLTAAFPDNRTWSVISLEKALNMENREKQEINQINVENKIL